MRKQKSSRLLIRRDGSSITQSIRLICPIRPDCKFIAAELNEIARLRENQTSVSQLSNLPHPAPSQQN